MSTIPLSAREGYMQNISGDDAPPPSIERDDSKLDALLEAAIDNAADSIKRGGESGRALELGFRNGRENITADVLHKCDHG